MEILQISLDIPIGHAIWMVEVRASIEDDSGRNLAECLFRAGDKIGVNQMPKLLVRKLLHDFDALCRIV